MLAASRLLSMVGGDGEWLTWTMLGMFAGMTTCRDACKEVAIGSQLAKSVPFRLSGSSALVEGGASNSVLFWSTSIRGGSQMGSSVVATFQSGSSSKSNSKALRPPFSPSGQTTLPPHNSSFHICNWSR